MPDISALITNISIYLSIYLSIYIYIYIFTFDDRGPYHKETSSVRVKIFVEISTILVTLWMTKSKFLS